MKPNLRPVPRVIKTLQAYARLHDGLSEMVEGGRLTENELPNDYDWLADSLADLAPQIDQILSEVCSVSHRPAYTISESPKGHPMYIRIEMDGRLLCSIGATHGIADWQRQHARRIVEALELLDWISPMRPTSSS